MKAALRPLRELALRVDPRSRHSFAAAYERLLRSDVKYRFSIDMASLKAE